MRESEIDDVSHAAVAFKGVHLVDQMGELSPHWMRVVPFLGNVFGNMKKSLD